MKTYTIKVTYFKQSGKFYAEGEYETSLSYMFEVFREFEEMLKKGIRPGLVNGHSNFIAVLDCEGHPKGYPAAFVGKA